MLSVNGADDALMESRACQAAPLLPFGFAIPGLVFAPQNDGERGAGVHVIVSFS